ncbi:glycine zipper 2TM domain-containing protein [Luteimonas sp. A277]
MRLHHIAIASALSIAAAGCAHSQAPVRTQGYAPTQGQTYGPRDEGRTFNDGTRVICENVEVARDTSDPNRIAGTAAGAVIGGLVGNQVGSGSGRKAATVGGAVAGGAIGRHVQGNRQEAQGERVIEQRCWRGR